MRDHRALWHAIACTLLLTVSLAADEPGLKVPPGFRVTVFADETLANDTYAMTLDAHGNVAVTTAGSVKILHDDNGDGRADRAVDYARTPTGGMGLCFDGDDLMFCGDGWLSRYRDRDGDGRADGDPERLVPLRFAEHGGHAMRLGPDGWWYVIGGNDSGIRKTHATLETSPVREPEAGAVLRISQDGRSREILAHGFRNPYDFDFNSAGDLFTYDSDVERDFLLPWYTPTRIYHVAPGGHHGWRLEGFMRSWCRKDYFLDTVDILAPIGRGSPTGVVCYRHDQFPSRYRDGIFALDWTFGKVYFLPLEPRGSSYGTRPEVFLEPTGSQGFDPTDAVVAPDGALLISIGGRRTRGAVYRVEYVGDRPKPSPLEHTPLARVLAAPQPLDAWSRSRWVPEARKLGAEPFASAVADESLNAAEHVRAVEVLTELFGGIPERTAATATRSAEPRVRARVGWSLGRTRPAWAENLLATLATDPDPRVRLAALDAWQGGAPIPDAEHLASILKADLGDSDKRVRQAAARVASRLSNAEWERAKDAARNATPQARLSAALAAAWREPGGEQYDAIVDVALSVLAAKPADDLAVQAIRLLVIALGDYNLQRPPVEIATAYSLARPIPTEVADRILPVVRRFFPSNDERLDIEVSRALAMLEDDSPETLRKVVATWTEDSSATSDVHYLVVFSRLRAARTDDMAPKVAAAVLGLDRKQQSQAQRIKQSWNDRLEELVTSLVKRDPKLVDALLAHPEFAKPAHVSVANAFDAEHRQIAARLFRDAIARDPDFEWSGALVTLIAALPVGEARPLLRAQWENVALRDAILIQLAFGAHFVDRDKLLAGLESAQPQVVSACLEALSGLPKDESPEHLIPVLRLLRRLMLEPKEGPLRAQAVSLVARQTGTAFPVDDRSSDLQILKKSYEPIFAWFRERYPALVRTLEHDDTEDATAWDALKASIDWGAGDAKRGESVFRTRACLTCHTGPSRLGPDLAGVSSRFSRDDLWTAIVTPNREVAPPYRVTMVETKQGTILSGVVAFESADGLIVQTGASETVRIATLDIASRQPSARSLMPTGLLKGLTPREIADLFRYIETLEPPKKP